MAAAKKSPAELSDAGRKAAEARHSTLTYFRTVAKRSQKLTAEEFTVIQPLISEAMLLSALKAVQA